MNGDNLIRHMKKTGAHAGRGTNGEIGICEMTTDEHFETASRFQERIGIGSLAEDLTVHRIRLLRNAHVVSFNIAGEIHDPEIIAAISELPCLEDLMCRLKGEHVCEMCASLGRSMRLKELHVAQSDIDDKAAAHLATLTSLQEIELSHTKIQNSLAFLRCMPELHYVSLSQVKLSISAIEDLSQVTSLTTLSLSENGLPGSAACLIRRLRILERLYFIQEQQTDCSEALTEFKCLQRLQSLGITSWMLTPAGIEILADYPSLKKISISLITQDDPRLKTLAVKYPNLEIFDYPTL